MSKIYTTTYNEEVPLIDHLWVHDKVAVTVCYINEHYNLAMVRIVEGTVSRKINLDPQGNKWEVQVKINLDNQDILLSFMYSRTSPDKYRRIKVFKHTHKRKNGVLYQLECLIDYGQTSFVKDLFNFILEHQKYQYFYFGNIRNWHDHEMNRFKSHMRKMFRKAYKECKLDSPQYMCDYKKKAEERLYTIAYVNEPPIHPVMQW